jgi:HK97 family phage major capsid protein
MKSIQALREEKNVVAKRVQDLMAASQQPGTAWTPENQSTYDADMAKIEALNAEIVRTERALEALKDSRLQDQIENAANGKKVSASKRLLAKWLKGGDAALTAEDWTQIRNTMSTTTGSQGGYTVQSDVASVLFDALKDFSGVRQAATVIQTDMGNSLSFPTSDGTSETGELIAQNTTATAADPTFGTVALDAYKFSSKIIAVPFELLQDSNIDIEAFINRRFADRLGRVTNTYFTTGSGSSQPKGVVTASTLGKTGASGQTTTVIADDLIDLVHSVDVAYRSLGRCAFMMNDATLATIRKLKDSTGRPIFLPGYDGLSGPMADTILGYPVIINNDVAVMAASAKSILFGDFSFYYIRDVMQAELFRFTDSAYAKLGQVGYLAWMRSGGNLLDTGGCIKHYINAAS